MPDLSRALQSARVKHPTLAARAYPLVRYLRLARARIQTPRRIRSYLRRHQVVLLHLGSGVHQLTGWLNTDIEPRRAGTAYLDVTKVFPLPDRSVDFIFTEHQIEHLTYRQGSHMLHECHRVLRDGGLVRIATPDLGKLVEIYRSPADAAISEFIGSKTARAFPGAAPNATLLLNTYFFSWGHRFLYDEQTLRSQLASAGFAEVSCAAAGRSRHSRFQGIDRRSSEIDTLILEARKSRAPVPSR